jgi:ABC-type dipeptide/oligopeptide/nickel transport system ATPase subunit|tara:strand:- start:1264 stop:1644 length:381 start_codon:yes stop_codon:yes gene_type:complete
MSEQNIKKLLRRILREDVVTDATNKVHGHLEKLVIAKEQEEGNGRRVINKPSFPRIVEMMPQNPKKAFSLYENVYETLKEGAPTPKEVNSMWKKYAESTNIIMYVRRIAKFIHKYYGENTGQKIEK